MILRLRRIQSLVVFLSALCAVGARSSGLMPATGVLVGGFAVWLDFVVIRELVGAMLVRSVPRGHLVPMAMAKTLALVLVPAMALLLPRTIVDGVSFAIGVTTLPLAVMIDACFGVPIRTGDV